MKHNRAKKIAKKYMEWWVKWTGLGWWNVTSGYPDGINDGEVAGTCEVKWEYLTAHIDFGITALRHMSDDEIEYVVVHELMHVFLNEMREQGQQHEERVATLLAKAFLWVRDQTREERK